MPELEVLRSVPFNVDAVYATGGSTLYGRYVNVSIILCEVLSVHNTYFYCRLALDDEVVDRGSYDGQ
jgi:hypothetical protein